MELIKLVFLSMREAAEAEKKVKISVIIFSRQRNIELKGGLRIRIIIIDKGWMIW